MRVRKAGKIGQGNRVIHDSKGGKVINTSFIERLNGTFRERLASLTKPLSPCCLKSGNASCRHVSDWVYLQFLYCSSAIKQGSRSWRMGMPMYTCHGKWSHRSC